MIQDIAPYRYHNEYKPGPPKLEDYVLCYRDKSVLIKWIGEEIDFPKFSDLQKWGENWEDSCQYLFLIDDRRFYLVNDISCPMGEGYVYENTEVFRGASPQYLAFAGVTGSQLNRWYASHKFCGCCQTPMIHSDLERMVQCPKCGLMEYPKLSPAVIVAVAHGNKILLSKYAGREYTNYALLAGFTEIGETLEETVRREVMEEVGLKVKNIRYYKSQPWSFTDTLLAGFYVELDGKEDITLDEEELSMAEWFVREEIPVEPSRDSLTNEMIMRFKRGEV